MEFDQLLFKKIMNFYRRKTNRETDEVKARTVYLQDITARLGLISRALTGLSIEILAAEEEGGWKNSIFYLPQSMSRLPSLEENLQYYIFRSAYLSTQSSLGLNWGRNEEKKSLDESRKMGQEASPKVLEVLKEEFPSVFTFGLKLQEYAGQGMLENYWIYGKYMVQQDVFEEGGEDDFDRSTRSKESVQPTTEIKSKAVEEVEILSVDKKAQEDYMLTHNFEKVETAEEFSGVWRNFDGDDSLEEDEDALKELNLGHLVRTDEVAHSVYQAEFRDLKNIADSADSSDEGQYILYDEWNFQKKRYKIDYCKVYLKKLKGGDQTYAAKCIAENGKMLRELRRKFAQINQIRRAVRKMPQGDSIDIDAVVDWYSDIHSGITPSENLYYSKRKKESDLAILFLMDLSMSTDSYADGNRVLDVEKQAVILFGEVLWEYGIHFAVGGFYSKTRNNCSYLSIKDFSDEWTKGKQNLGLVRPEGYTRIGPALRHAKSLIEEISSQNKWVILLSDGKPNDYDKYEGRYGISDVKQALREMHEKHINTYAIAIESIARYYLPQMFGQNYYNILSHPSMLIQSLATLYRRIQNK